MARSLPTLLAGVCLLSALGASPLQAAPGVLRIDSFNYGDDRLRVEVASSEARQVEIEWRALDARAWQAWKRERFRLAKGSTEVSLPVAKDSLHRVRIRAAGLVAEAWTQRGVWFSAPRDLKRIESVRSKDLRGIERAPGDVLLAGGYRVEARGDGQRRLEIGRVLRRREESSMPLAGFEGIVLGLKSNARSARVTLTETDGEAVRYFDHWLELQDELSRYVIPLSSFIARERDRKASVKALYSISIELGQATSSKQYIEVSSMALTRRVYRLRPAERKGSSVTFSMEGRPAPRGARVFVRSVDGSTTSRSLRRATTFRVPDNGEYWLCHPDGQAQSCDPADAPRTGYSLPPAWGAPLVIDDFETSIPVNTARVPTFVFTSSTSDRTRTSVTRRDGRLFLRFPAQSASDYAGYSSPLPPLPPWLRSVELSFARVDNPAAIRVGVRGQRGDEPKIRLSNYYSTRTKRAVIPLAAFRGAMLGLGRDPDKLGRYSAITLAIEPRASGDVASFELEEIGFVADLGRLLISRFDGDPSDQTAMGGAIGGASTGGARVRMRTAADGGRSGGMLVVEMEQTGPSSTAIAALGLGRLDLRPYKRLRLSIRGSRGGERFFVRLSSGKSSARVRSSDHFRVEPEWTEVSVPLSAFRGVRLHAVSQLSLVSDVEPAEATSIFVDDLSFE